MGAGVDSIRDVVAMCPAGVVAGPAPTASAVLLFSAVCPPGVLLETCIPFCDETTNGDVLLLQQAGNDMRSLLCEMNSYFFSWIGAPPHPRLGSRSLNVHDILCLTRAGLRAAGAAGLGGFLGENVLAFVPALISGAAGVYALTLLTDAGTERTSRSSRGRSCTSRRRRTSAARRGGALAASRWRAGRR
jgi:hypothetical protein